MHNSACPIINLNGLHLSIFAADDADMPATWVPLDLRTDRQLHDD